MFYVRLRELREKNNIERQDLADDLHMSYSALSKYETNQRKADYETLIKIADYFEVTVDYLIGKTNNPNATIIKEDQWLFNLSDDEKEHLQSELQTYRRLKKQFSHKE